MPWLIDILLTAVAGSAGVGALVKGRDLVREWYIRSRQRIGYLKRLKESIEHSGTGSELHPVFSRFNLAESYVVPILLLQGGQAVQARDYLMDECSRSKSLLLLIDGAFGSGKTALCLDLAYNLAKKTLDDQRSKRVFVEERILPIFIPLREWSSEMHGDISRILSHYLEYYGLSAYSSFDKLAKKERILLLLDGFDQMSLTSDNTIAVEFLQALHKYLQGKRNIGLIITARSEFIAHTTLLAEAFAGQIRVALESPTSRVPIFGRAHLGELTDKQLRDFLSLNSSVRRLGQSGDSILDQIRADVHLEEIARNPLLLTMLLQVASERGELAARNVGTIFQGFTEFWIAHDSRLAAIGTVDKRHRFVEDLSISLLRSGTEAVFPEEVAGFLGSKKEWSFMRQVVMMEGHYKGAGARSFLLVNRNGSFMFVHRSFMEFFCSGVLLQCLRTRAAIPSELLPKLYSNLIIWFLRFFVHEQDFPWLLEMLDDSDIRKKRLAYALLPGVALARGAEISKALRVRFDSETDVEIKRHILYGIGWLGGNPCSPEFLAFIREQRKDWQQAPIVYYHSTDRQRAHCIRRLFGFASGNREFFNNRGLYIIDLAEVGEPEDIPILKIYAGAAEKDQVVRELAKEAINAIEERRTVLGLA